MSNIERRRSPRQAVLDSFSLFVVVPRKGVHRLHVADLSQLGIGFDLDIEGEPQEDFPVATGENLELHLYLNQSLYIPLSLLVARIDTSASLRRVGAEFTQRESQGFRAFESFFQMLLAVSKTARFSDPPPV